METENHHTFNIKYYKGLENSTSKAAMEYFQEIFTKSSLTSDDAIIVNFTKKFVDQRNVWTSWNIVSW